MDNESELYTRMLYGYVEGMVRWLRQIPVERWDWTPAVSAPTVRQVAELTWCTLLGDRQHLEQPDVALHSLLPDPPRDPETLCKFLEEEVQWWRQWFAQQTEATYLAPRKQFGVFDVNVRWMVYHAMQQVVYKMGQLSWLYYALGLDGTEPYQSPSYNEFYKRYQQQIEERTKDA